MDKAAAKVVKLGGKVNMPKTAVPGMAYFAACTDTENNVFGLWERDRKYKIDVLNVQNRSSYY